MTAASRAWIVVDGPTLLILAMGAAWPIADLIARAVLRRTRR